MNLARRGLLAAPLILTAPAARAAWPMSICSNERPSHE